MIGDGYAIRAGRDGDAEALVAIHLAGRDTYYRGVLPDEKLDDPADHAELQEAPESGTERLGLPAPVPGCTSAVRPYPQP